MGHFDSEGSNLPHGQEGFSMKPPAGFHSQLYPLRHRLRYAATLSLVGETQNTVMFPLIRSTKDTDVVATAVEVNPHNINYNEDGGAIVQQMSIIDKLRLSLSFNMTSNCNLKNETASGVFSGDSIQHLKFLWRPIFFQFPEKLDAVDDDTALSVATILALTKDATNEDIVPITTNKLPVQGASDLAHAVSTVNQAEAYTDLNMTTDLTMEDHVWDEDLFQSAKLRYTNKGALKACVGRTRHVHLTQSKPYQRFFINKFVPRSVRRIMPYTFMAIQVHLPLDSDTSQDYMAVPPVASVGHLGIKALCHYDEWNSDFYQEMTGTG